MSDTTPESKPPCGGCGGSHQSHFDDEGRPITQHAYTEQSGELVTHAELAKRQGQSSITGGSIRLGPGQIIPMPGGTPQNRLIEVLLDKGIIDTPEALYALGVGSKPQGPSEGI